MEIKIGDVVRLRSGGPPMTVVSVDDNEIAVMWFEKTTAQRAVLDRRTIELENERWH